MTLTALMPSLRRSLPDPLIPTHWPMHTVTTTSDVIVAAVSMTELSKLVGTPLVHVGDEQPGPDGRHRCADGHCTVVVTRVTDSRRLGNGRIDLALDLDRPCVGLDFAEARLIGRSSVFPAGRVQLHTVADRLRHPSQLPEDVGVGDLVAIPWPGAHAARELHV